MKTTRKAFSVLLAALLCFGCMMAAFAASGTAGNLTWDYDEGTNTLTISGTGDMPDYSGSYPDWYFYRDEIKAIVIENGVTSIGEKAFEFCSAINSLTIPGSVKIIGQEAFQSCTSLKQVTIMQGVQEIDVQAFCDCSSLESIVIPVSVTCIGSAAFADCKALKTINYAGSSEDWESIEKGDFVFAWYSEEEDQVYLIEDLVYSFNYKTESGNNNSERGCPWCGGVHEGFFQKIIGWFHKVFAFLFGARY